MKDYFKPKTWLITILMFMVAFGLSLAMVYYEFGLEKNIKITHASANDNVSGWAWNSNIGWISFNCDHTTDGTSPPTNTCVNSDYGVKIDINTGPTLGNFSGYAWSANVGWISFNRSDTGDPPANPFKNGVGNDPIAQYKSGEVSGWAKILSLSDNGWIKLRKSIGSEPDYGVSIDPATGNFSGWAWNGGDVGSSAIGWISFNCDHTSDGTLAPYNTNTCASSNYKVVGNIDRPPTVTNLTAPNWSYVQASESGALNAYLDWTFSDQDAGSSESAYQIIVNTQNNINNPFFDSGKCVAFTFGGKCTLAPGAGDQFPLQLALLNISDSLDYNTHYYWWVKVWDNYGADSGWLQYNTSQDVPYPEADDGAPLTFTTYKHEMPIVNFSWFPLNPSKGEKVKFTDKSKVYSSSAPSTAVDCTDALCDWAWSAPGASITGNTTATPTITFNSTSNQTVTLKVTDQDGYNVSHSETINVNANLPGWKEVKPE